MMKYFKPNEFNCACCGQNKMLPSFNERLDKARGYAGIPFSLNSAYRCLKHNRKIHSKDTSSHLKGVAADISATTSLQRYIIISALLRAGFNRIGIAKTFIHVDSDKEKHSNVIWIY